MKNYLFLGFILLIGLSACDSSVQYNVYVKNSTSEDLKVVFKSLNETSNKGEQTIQLKAGEQKQIISTINIELGESASTTPNHCNLVAEYIHAYTKDKIPSKTKWCDQDIKFEKEDIGQAVFTIDYSEKDF